MKQTDLTLGVLHRSLLTRPNGSQSCEVGFSLLELSFLQLLELQNASHESEMTDGIVLFIIVHIIIIVLREREIEIDTSLDMTESGLAFYFVE